MVLIEPKSFHLRASFAIKGAWGRGLDKQPTLPGYPGSPA